MGCGGGAARGGQGVLCSQSQFLCLSQQPNPAGENIFCKYSICPDNSLFFYINVIGGAFAANMQMCQVCWKRVQETMPNSARLKVKEEGPTEPGGS